LPGRPGQAVRHASHLPEGSVGAADTAGSPAYQHVRRADKTDAGAYYVVVPALWSALRPSTTSSANVDPLNSMIYICLGGITAMLVHEGRRLLPASRADHPDHALVRLSGPVVFLPPW
jgi:hypothetical protein